MIKISLTGLKEFQKSVSNMTDTMKKEVSAELRVAADDFRDRAIVDAPADVGLLRSQITVKPITELSYEVVSGSKYSAPMEFGTKGKFTPIPGVDASQFKGKLTGSYLDFISNIKNWVKRKGIPASAAYPIARSILKNGVTPHPFFFKQIPIVRRDLVRNLKNVLG